jgi:hypothetical protein
MLLNMEKCQLGRASVHLLGHLITAEGAAPVQHLAVIQELTASSSIVFWAGEFLQRIHPSGCPDPSSPHRSKLFAEVGTSDRSSDILKIPD